MAEKAYWIVVRGQLASDYCDCTSNYDNENAACRVAENLAVLNPGARYRVFKCIGHALVESPSIWVDYE